MLEALIFFGIMGYFGSKLLGGILDAIPKKQENKLADELKNMSEEEIIEKYPQLKEPFARLHAERDVKPAKSETSEPWRTGFPADGQHDYYDPDDYDRDYDDYNDYNDRDYDGGNY